MKKKILFINLFFFVILALAFITPTKVGANSNNYIYTNSKALTVDGQVIPDSIGYFTNKHKDSWVINDDFFHQILTGEKKVYYCTNDEYYTVLFESLPEEMFLYSDDVTSIFSVKVNNGYWAYYKYNYALDKDGNLINDGIGKFTESVGSYKDSNGNNQYLYEFVIYVRDGYILDEFETYIVDTFYLHDKIKDSFGTNKFIAVKNRAWALVDDIQVYEKTLEVEAYVEIDSNTNLWHPVFGTLENWPFFYFNFDIPISSIKQIELNFVGVNRLFLGIFKTYKEYSIPISATQTTTGTFRLLNKNTYSCITKGKFDKEGKTYLWQVIPPHTGDTDYDNNLADLILGLSSVDFIAEDSLSITKLLVEYMDCTYVFVDGELGDIKITEVKGPGYEPYNKNWWDKLSDWFKRNLVYIIIVFVLTIIISVGYKVYLVNKISNNKRRN